MEGEQCLCIVHETMCSNINHVLVYFSHTLQHHLGVKYLLENLQEIIFIFHRTNLQSIKQRGRTIFIRSRAQVNTNSAKTWMMVLFWGDFLMKLRNIQMLSLIFFSEVNVIWMLFLKPTQSSSLLQADI